VFVPKGVAQLLPIVLLLLFAYIVLIRLPRRRAREVTMLQSTLTAGDQVMLTSGIFGRVEAMADDKIHVEISPGVVVTVHRGAIGKIVRDDPPDDDTDSGDADRLATENEAAGSPQVATRDPDASALVERSDPDGEPNRGAF
jgi:preprotein translocase subunit YajC